MEPICREAALDKVFLVILNQPCLDFFQFLIIVLEIGLAERYNLVARITGIRLVSRTIGNVVEEVYEFEISLVYESTDATDDAISNALLGALEESGLNFDVKKPFISFLSFALIFLKNSLKESGSRTTRSLSSCHLSECRLDMLRRRMCED